jgi:Legionella pneumophila major outer membrane protein precursor
MKKLTFGLSLLFTGITINSFAAVPTGTPRYNVCIPSFCGGFTFGLAGLYWRPSTPQLDYALTFPDIDDDFREGHLHNVDPNYNWGFRANIGYVFPCSGNDVLLSYTHFNHSHSNHVSLRNENEVLIPTLTDEQSFTNEITIPNILSSEATISVTGVPRAAHANTNFKLDAVDLDFGQYVNVGCRLRFRWFGGARYARLENRLDTRYHSQGELTTTRFTDPTVPSANITFDVITNICDNLRQKSKFDGVGPRFGLDASYHLGGGFGVVGDVSTALIVGREDSHLNDEIHSLTTATVTAIEEFSGIAPPFTIGQTFSESSNIEQNFRHPRRTRVVPNLDARLGLDYSYIFCNCSKTKLTLEVGYSVSHYFNTIDRLSEAGIDHPEFRTRQTIDTSFDGPYVGIQVTV